MQHKHSWVRSWVNRPYREAANGLSSHPKYSQLAALLIDQVGMHRSLTVSNRNRLTTVEMLLRDLWLSDAILYNDFDQHSGSQAAIGLHTRILRNPPSAT
jgi:hypothetical protein